MGSKMLKCAAPLLSLLEFSILGPSYISIYLYIYASPQVDDRVWEWHHPCFTQILHMDLLWQDDRSSTYYSDDQWDGQGIFHPPQSSTWREGHVFLCIFRLHTKSIAPPCIIDTI